MGKDERLVEAEASGCSSVRKVEETATRRRFDNHAVTGQLDFLRPLDILATGWEESSPATAALDTYIAISSDTLLWLACGDPLLAAFKLAADLEFCCQVDEEYKDIKRAGFKTDKSALNKLDVVIIMLGRSCAEDCLNFALFHFFFKHRKQASSAGELTSAYWQLHENVMATSVRIVEQCWRMQDVEILVSQKYGIPLSDPKLQFLHLHMALGCHMRTFLATVNIQSALRSFWHGDWADYGNHARKDKWRVLQHSLLLPFRALIQILSAGLLVKSFNTLLARFISRVASYLLFLAVLLVLWLWARGGDRASNRTIKGNTKRS